MRRVVLMGVVMLVACVDGSRDVRRSDLRRVPVVFVHGAGLSSASWAAMKTRFEALGYHLDVLVSVDIPRTGFTNEATAREIVLPAIEDVLLRSQSLAAAAGQDPPSKVDIVTHSMGAVSGRYSVVLAPSLVRAWVAVAGANHGTEALCGSLAPADREMCPAFARRPEQSGIQVLLNGTVDSPQDESPYGIGPDENVRVQPTAAKCIAYFTIRIEPDEWIEPPASAALSGAGGIAVEVDGLPLVESSAGNYVFMASTSHDDLPSDSRVIDFVARILGRIDEDLPQKCRSVLAADHVAAVH
jgi:pimeloyl-ACP methyl ester carboxylesterase